MIEIRMIDESFKLQGKSYLVTGATFFQIIIHLTKKARSMKNAGMTIFTARNTGPKILIDSR